jgi:8-oxo-dGTP diphosphatase
VIFLKTFLDIVGNKVVLSFEERSFPEEAKHVLVITQFGEDWLLTNHKKRGLEFPGGKMEQGETLEEAARREVYEETGAVLSKLIRLGEYRVEDPNETFVKAVFWGIVNHMENKPDYLETKGPSVIKGDILNLRFGNEYSFIMKDEVIAECLNKIDQLKKE